MDWVSFKLWAVGFPKNSYIYDWHLELDPALTYTNDARDT